jgi:hypothetical protein
MASLLMRLPALAAIGALIGAAVAGAHAAVQPLLLVTVLLLPVLLPRRILYPADGDSPADDSGDDGGGGRGPHPEPPKPPDAPRGGLPLPDAQPARIRLRDHGRRVLTPHRQRRPAREPERSPRRRRVARA